MGKYTYNHGNIQNSIYLWHLDNSVNEKEIIDEHYKIINNLKKK